MPIIRRGLIPAPCVLATNGQIVAQEMKNIIIQARLADFGPRKVAAELVEQLTTIGE